MTERSVFVLFVGSMSLDTMKYVLADGRMTPDYSGGANAMSLNEAREAYKQGKPII